MGDESIEDIQAALREASMRISAEAAAAADLYVLEKGPFALEHDGDGYMFVVKQDIRLRLKTAEEIRAEARADVFRVFNSDPGKHSITNEQHVLFCAECHALRHLYEQGKRDAAEEARAAERRHWEARFRNAEQAHAAALAAAVAAARAEVVTVELVGDYATGYNAGLIEGDAKGRREGKRLAEAAAAPRTLTADDPEPAVTSVGLDRDQSVWQRVGSTEQSRWVNPFMGTREWSDVLARGPVTLIHDGEDR